MKIFIKITKQIVAQFHLNVSVLKNFIEVVILTAIWMLI